MLDAVPFFFGHYLLMPGQIIRSWFDRRRQGVSGLHSTLLQALDQRLYRTPVHHVADTVCSQLNFVCWLLNLQCVWGRRPCQRFC